MKIQSKLLKMIMGLSICTTAACVFPIVSCSKEDIEAEPRIDDEQKTQKFVDKKAIFNFTWEGWRPANNEFDNLKLSLTCQPEELNVEIGNKPTVAPDKTFSVEICILNATLPHYSENITFNLEIDCTVKSSHRHYEINDLTALYIPNEVILAPEKKSYDMVTDVNTPGSEVSYTQTDEFILTDKNIKPTELNISMHQSAGDPLGEIFVDIHATGQSFYLYVETEEYNPFAGNYQITLTIEHDGQTIYQSNEFELIFKPQMVETNKNIRCFPNTDQTNTWHTTEDFCLLHAPSADKPIVYIVDLIDKPEGWTVIKSQFYKSGTDKTGYRLSITFLTDTAITEYGQWDVGLTIKCTVDGKEITILNNSRYNFYTAPAIDVTQMIIEDNVVGQAGDQHTQLIVKNLDWIDRFSSSFDILDLPKVTIKAGDWPQDLIQPITTTITPQSGNLFTTTLDVYTTSKTPLPVGEYSFIIKFIIKDPTKNYEVNDEVECFHMIEE